MSWAIRICRAKPNPAGKDSGPGANKEQQLLGEWVDLQNTGDGAVRLSSLHLCDNQFSQFCALIKENVIYWNGRADQILSPGQVVRVHTGKSSYSLYMLSGDSSGVHLHAYAESGNFILNNRCGDTISVYWKGEDGAWHFEDKAKYAPNVPDGKILLRQGEWLV